MRWTVATLLLACGAPERDPLVGSAGSASEACGDVAAPAPDPCRADVLATIERVVDGDTLDVGIDGVGSSRVRLIGIDAPEHDEGGCGRGAAERLAALAAATTRVRLAFDAECRDAYDRDLAYVWSGETMWNAAMLAGGFAQACPFPPNTAHADAFACLAARAEAKGEGLWALGCHRDACFR